MKNTFALFQLVFGFGFFALIAARIGGRLPFDISSFAQALGSYAALGILVLALHDYGRIVTPRRLPPPPRTTPIRPRKSSPIAPLNPAAIAAWRRTETRPLAS